MKETKASLGRCVLQQHIPWTQRESQPLLSFDSNRSLCPVEFSVLHQIMAIGHLYATFTWLETLQSLVRFDAAHIRRKDARNISNISALPMFIGAACSLPLLLFISVREIGEMPA